MARAQVLFYLPLRPLKVLVLCSFTGASLPQVCTCWDSRTDPTYPAEGRPTIRCTSLLSRARIYSFLPRKSDLTCGAFGQSLAERLQGSAPPRHGQEDNIDEICPYGRRLAELRP